MNNKLSEELIYNNFLVKKYRKTSIFSSFFFINIFALSISASFNVAILKYKFSQTTSKQVIDFFSKIDYWIYWLIFLIFIFLIFLTIIYAYTQNKKRKKLIPVLVQAIYLQVNGFEYKDSFLKENNLWEEYKKFKTKHFREYKLNYGVGIWSSWTSTICFWMLLFKYNVFFYENSPVANNPRYIPNYTPLRKNKIRHYLINCDFSNIYNDKTALNNQNLQQQLNNYSNFRDYFLERSKKFFKSRDWSSQNVIICWFILVFTISQIVIIVLVDKFLNHSFEFTQIIIFGILLCTASWLWVYSDQNIFSRHWTEFIIFNFQVKERYNPYIKVESKNMIDNFENLSVEEQIKMFELLMKYKINEVIYYEY
ncbi:hypothetical protein [Mesomycoplasma hyorhinis]|uniref:Uncharacterized protein n=1 Tax=Mesomycoplasma hyorhinis SK76 TaxID=1118964 RepID=A0AAI8ALZ4_MESHY|nr:hypothetical protein [Mesomycoplasma hyorhinis]AFX74124.1 hypothetical protein MOS_195 [Mesomycoplasma hyorhinis SK76]